MLRTRFITAVIALVVLGVILFVLPGAVVILVLSVLYAGYNDLTIVQAVFFGIKAAVLAVDTGTVPAVALARTSCLVGQEDEAIKTHMQT